jgi:hemerythrin-like domain-containing protein
MDAFSLLKADHEKVAELFEQLESASGKAKLGVFDQIRTELELHAHIEEKLFYPALEKPSETKDLTLEAYEEHKQVKTLLRELGRARTANDEWEAKAKVLKENVEHHVEEEENELFPKASSVLSDEQIEEIGERMEAEKGRKQRGQGSRISAGKSSTKASGARKTAKKSSSRTTKKAAGKKGGASKKGGTKKSAKKSSKSSGSKGGKKSGSKKSGSKKSRR